MIPARLALRRPAATCPAAALLAVVAALAPACRAPRETSSEFLVEVAQRTFSSYAWVDERSREAAGAPEDAEVRAALDAGLARIGLRREALSAAQLLVSYATSIETEQRQSDPYVTGHVAEEVEFGTLTVELLDVESGEAVWRGTSRAELRRSAVMYGGVTTNRFQPTDAPREWNVEARVRELLAPLEGRL